MKLSLWNLFGRRAGRSARNVSRRARTVRLQVESLEERAVPTANLANVDFPIFMGTVPGGPVGMLHIKSENLSTGQFNGVFQDFTRNYLVPINGQVKQISAVSDSMTFQGTATRIYTDGIFTSDSIYFNGQVSEANDLTHVMVGKVQQEFFGLGGWFTETTLETVDGAVSSYWLS
jgi:hypothetical protein